MKTLRKLKVDTVYEIVKSTLATDPLEYLHTRKRKHVEIRQLTMYFMTEHTKSSLSEIGKFFNRDHATVLHAKKTIKNLIETEEEIKKMYELIKGKLYSSYNLLKHDEELDLLEHLKRTKEFNIGLINRTINIKKIIEDLPEEIRKKYFKSTEELFQIKKHKRNDQHIHSAE